MKKLIKTNLQNDGIMLVSFNRPPVNALSTDLRVEVHREGKVFEQEYKIGKPQYDVREIGTTDKTGTVVTFTPDNTIFIETVYSFDVLSMFYRYIPVFPWRPPIYF